MEKYNKYPKTRKLAAAEIIKIIDDFWMGEIRETIAKEYIVHYARTDRLLTDDGKGINLTIASKIGKRRTKLVKELLGTFQTTITEKLK